MAGEHILKLQDNYTDIGHLDEPNSKIAIGDINLYEAMNNTIASLLKIRDNDICSMYAAKLIESLQKENAELKSRIDYIQNGDDKMFIPPENSQNRGED